MKKELKKNIYIYIIKVLVSDQMQKIIVDYENCKLDSF